MHEQNEGRAAAGSGWLGGGISVRLFAHGSRTGSEPASAAKGRPKRGNGEMPLPKQLKDTERLAGDQPGVRTCACDYLDCATLEEDYARVAQRGWSSRPVRHARVAQRSAETDILSVEPN